MYIEDIIDRLVGMGSLLYSSPTFLSSYDSNLLHSFDTQISNSLGLTEKQRILSIRILKKYSEDISTFLTKPVDTFLDSPQFKFPIRAINVVKTVKIFKDTEKKNSLVRVSFPFDEKLVNEIKDYKKQYDKTKKVYNYHRDPDIMWNQQSRSWEFHLREDHIDWLYSKLIPNGFTFDNDLLKFSNQIEQIKSNVEDHVPMVNFDGKNFKFSNAHRNIPQPQSTDLLEVLFAAKKYGIATWDNSIDEALRDETINYYTRKVLFSEYGKEMTADPNIVHLDDLADTINYVGNTVFVIPGGDELKMLKSSHEFLQRMGIKNEQISVLFRLDGISGKLCNDYVKENQLNNPIDEKIKIFFISTKVPKPLLKTSVSIDAIVNLGSTTVHYTLKNLLKNHHFVINYTTKKQQERLIY